MQGGTFPVIAAEFDALHSFVLSGKGLPHLPGPVCASIIHQDDFIAQLMLPAYPVYPLTKFRKGFFFVEQGNDYRNIHG
jgi:hypothetical protein